MKKNILKRIADWFKFPFISNSHSHAPDYKLLLAIGMLLVFGILMLSSASAVVAFQDYGDSYHFVKHQLLFGILPGLLFFFMAIRFPYAIWKKFAFWMLLISILLLIVVLIPGIGTTINGATRWIRIGSLQFQPSEIVKITFLIYLATWLAKKGLAGISDIEYGTIPFLSIIGLVSFLFLKQPDMGTLIVILCVSLLIYFVAGAPWRHVFYIVGIGILLFVVLILSSSYRADRLKTFMGGGDVLGQGYHIQQAKIAIGSGGFWGLGLGHSQQKFRYLPEVQGDSIFAIIAEELGFIFALAVILVFVYIMIRGFKIARGSPDEFGRLLAVGITGWFVIQAMINLGAMVGILPLTGITLPFISYGGSSLAISLFAVGILLNISRFTKD